VQPVCVVERVSGLVPQKAHRFFFRFDRGGEVLLDSGEALVGEIKGYAY